MVRTPTRRTARTPAQRVAIDLGATSVHVVEMAWNPGGRGVASAQIVRRGSAELPPGLWDDLTAQRETLANAIREAMTRAGITAKAVVASLPRRLVTLRFMRLPPAAPEQMRGMVAFEAQQYVLFPLDEVILDYHALSGPLDAGEEEMASVLLVAAKRSLIADLMAVFDQLRLELRQLSISALALAENLRDALEPIALIDLEAGELEVVVVAEGRLLFTRSSALDVYPRDREASARTLANEVARSFLAYQNEYRHRPLSHVYLAGCEVVGLEVEQVEQLLSGVLDTPVTRWQNRLFPGGDPTLLPYAAAVGLALQTEEARIAPINLVPAERAERRARQTRLQRMALAGVVGVGILAATGFWITRQVQRQAAQRRELVRVNAEMNEAVTRLEGRQKEYDRKAALETALTEGLERRHPVVDVLLALSQSLPRSTSIWLTQYTFERGGTLTLRGETKSATAATDLVINLQRTGAFTEVRLGYLGDSQENSGGGGAALGTVTTVTPTAFQSPAPAAGLAQNLPNTTRLAMQPPPGGFPELPGGQQPQPPGGAAPAAPGGQQPGGGLPGMPGMPTPGGGMPVPGGTFPGGQFPGGPFPGGPFPGAPAPGAAPTAPAGPPAVTPGNAPSLPAPSQNPPANAITAPVRPPSPRSAGLTSFTITCRVNPNAASLLPAKLLTANARNNKTAATKKAATSSGATNSFEETDENGFE